MMQHAKTLIEYVIVFWVPSAFLHCYNAMHIHGHRPITDNDRLRLTFRYGRPFDVSHCMKQKRALIMCYKK